MRDANDMGHSDDADDSRLIGDLPTLHNVSPESASHESHRTSRTSSLLPPTQPLAGPGEEPGTEPGQPHAAGASAGLIVRSLLSGLAGFALIAVLVHATIRRPLYLHAEIRSGKLDILNQWRGQVYTAAFGSSHVHMGFDPRSFDRALQGTPLATRTLNLAVGGGSQTEQRAMALDYVRTLQAPPASSGVRACMVLLELGAGSNFLPGYLVHPRAINLYDLPTVRFVDSLTASDMSRSQFWGRRGFAYAAAAMHYMNVGMLSNELLPNLNVEQEYAWETVADRRGLLVLPPEPALQPGLAATIEHAPQLPPHAPGELLPGNRLLVQQLAAAADIRGVRFVYLVMPRLEDLTRYELYPDTLQVGGEAVPIINLARPDRFPELYKLSNWRDDSHLNEPGAALAGTLIARQLLAFQAQHAVPACGA